VTAAVLGVLVGLSGTLQPAGCGDDNIRRLLEAQVLMLRGDDAGADAAIASDARPDCDTRRVASLALRGWRQARALAPLGGAVEHLGPVRETLAALAAVPPALSLEAEYASTLILAAVAAAQDERPEMDLRLVHARDLSERLQARDRRALWPLPLNVASGELWFEVDRFADAVMAFERAVRADASSRALVGLARAHQRLGQLEPACAALARAIDPAPALREVIAKELARCR
jgi:tetratricopeptide (TPR) repeat protein